MRTFTSGGQRGWAERTGSKVHRGRGGDRHRAARNRRRVRRADCRIGRANCWHIGGCLFEVVRGVRVRGRLNEGVARCAGIAGMKRQRERERQAKREKQREAG